MTFRVVSGQGGPTIATFATRAQADRFVAATKKDQARLWRDYQRTGDEGIARHLIAEDAAYRVEGPPAAPKRRRGGFDFDAAMVAEERRQVGEERAARPVVRGIEYASRADVARAVEEHDAPRPASRTYYYLRAREADGSEGRTIGGSYGDLETLARAYRRAPDRGYPDPIPVRFVHGGFHGLTEGETEYLVALLDG
jgi:hypothetical protein